MTAAGQQKNFLNLGQSLQERLRLAVHQGDNFQVRCAIKEGKLIVLTQHPANMTIDAQVTFATLEQEIQSFPVEIEMPVQLYLWRLGENSPYARYSLTLHPPVGESHILLKWDESSFDQSHSSGEVEQSDPSSLWDQPISPPQPATKGEAEWEEPILPPEPTISSDIDPSSLWEEPRSPEPTTSSDTDPSSLWEESPSSQTDVDENSDGDDSSTVTEDVDAESPPQKRRFHPFAVGGAVAGMAALVGGGIYLATTPCLVSSCIPLQAAQQVQQKSQQVMRTAKSEQELVQVSEQIKAASQRLKTIPPWSLRHQEAQKLLQSFSRQSENINEVMAALQAGGKAAQQSQIPSQNLPDLQARQAAWRAAIAPLEVVQSQSDLYNFAQMKLNEYRNNLKVINQQMKGEEQALKRLNSARAVALAAIARQEAAKSVQDWQKVQATWQVAVNTLTKIPNGSSAFPDAQQLLNEYKPALAAVRDRATKEQIASKFYTQAVNAAAFAQRYEQQNQLSLAVNYWTQALQAAQQVPSDTIYSPSTQTLIARYLQNFKRSQAKLQTAIATQKARADLNKTCASGAIRICNYTIDNQGITVRLTADYENAVQRSAATATVRRDNQTVVGVINHLQILQQALEVISDNARQPLIIYNSKNQQIYAYPAR